MRHTIIRQTPRQQRRPSTRFPRSCTVSRALRVASSSRVARATTTAAMAPTTTQTTRITRVTNHFHAWAVAFCGSPIAGYKGKIKWQINEIITRYLA